MPRMAPYEAKEARPQKALFLIPRTAPFALKTAPFEGPPKGSILDTKNSAFCTENSTFWRSSGTPRKGSILDNKNSAFWRQSTLPAKAPFLMPRTSSFELRKASALLEGQAKCFQKGHLSMPRTAPFVGKAETFFNWTGTERFSSKASCCKVRVAFRCSCQQVVESLCFFRVGEYSAAAEHHRSASCGHSCFRIKMQSRNDRASTLNLTCDPTKYYQLTYCQIPTDLSRTNPRAKFHRITLSLPHTLCAADAIIIVQHLHRNCNTWKPERIKALASIFCPANFQTRRCKSKQTKCDASSKSLSKNAFMIWEQGPGSKVCGLGCQDWGLRSGFAARIQVWV